MTTMLQHVNIADTVPMSTQHGQPLRHVVGAAGSHLYALNMPPLHLARRHWHAHTDTILIVQSGHGMTLLDDLRPVVHGPQDVLLIPAGRRHVGVNLSATDDFVLLEVRADAPEALDVQLADWAQPRVEQLARRAQQAFAAGHDPVEAVLRSAA